MGASLFAMGRKDRWKWRFPALLAVALALPFLTTHVWIAASLERTLHDAYRFAIAERTGYDPDIALVVYDDLVARSTQRTSPVDRALLAKAITSIDSAKPRAIGLDMAFVQTTDELPELIAALRAVEAPMFVVYADPDGDRAVHWSPVVDDVARADQEMFWQQLSGSDVTKVSPAIGTGPARIARHWPQTSEGTAPLFAYAVTGTAPQSQSYQGGIRYRVLARDLIEAAGTDIDSASGMFPRYPLDLLTDELFASDYYPALAGRIVLVGADTFNADKLATPISRVGRSQRAAGVTVHAHMVRQALNREFPAPLGWLGVGVLTLVVVALAAATAMIEQRIFLLLGAGALQLIGLAVLPFGLEWAGIDILGLPLFGLLASSITAYFACASTLRDQRSQERAFAQGALGRYVPESVARQILADPDRLQLDGEQCDLVMMFTDLEGYTQFCHGREPRETAAILNMYLDAMTEVVLAHGGTLDKFVGDAIVAFWGSPIAYGDDASRAVACALAMQQEAARVAERTRELYGEAFGRTRIGIHKGPVIVGNFGGTARLQYTAMGDAMNIAARLESANKQIGSFILVSSAVASAAPGFTYRRLGRIAMSGVTTGVALLEPLQNNRAAYGEEWNSIVEALESGDETAVSRWKVFATDNADDPAVASIENRMEAIRKRDVYALRTK